MDTDEAWVRFREDSYRIQKTSIAEKLDVLAAAINEMQTDTKRTAELVPQLMGDEAAIGAANSMAGPDMMGGGDPMAGGGIPGEDIMADNNEMPPMDEGMDAGAGAEMPPMDEGMGAEAPVAEPPMDGGSMDMPPEDGGGMDEEMVGEEDFLSDEDLDALLNELYGGAPGAPVDAGMPEEGTPDPQIPTTGGGGLAEAAQNLVGALKQAAHEAVDQSDPERVMQLSQMESEIMNILGPEVGAAMPDGIPVEGLEGDMGAMAPEVPVDEAGIAEEVAEDVAAEEAPAAPPEGGEGEAPASDGEPKDDKKEEKDEESGSKDDKSDSKDDKKEEKDDESESTKKSATFEDIPDEIMEYADTQDAPTEAVKKSVMQTVPSMKDLLSGKASMDAFFKSTHEYVDDVEIYHDDYVDPIEQDCGMMKSEDREKLASARNIFDWDFGSRGQKDPDSISQAGEAQEAINHEGTTDPGSISDAEPIIAVTKSAEDISKPKASSGSTDPDSIAFADKPQKALSHKGTTDPDSIADAEKAVEPGTGDDNEGTVEKLSMGPITKSQEDSWIEMIQKSADDPEALRSIIKSIYNPVAQGVKDGKITEGQMSFGPYMDVDPQFNPNAPKMAPEAEAPVATNPVAQAVSDGALPEGQTNFGAYLDFDPQFNPNLRKAEVQGGKQLMSLHELMSIAKSDRPSLMATVNGDIITKDSVPVAKSSKPVVRMGHGVDPMKVIENDLNEWNLFKVNSRL